MSNFKSNISKKFCIFLPLKILMHNNIGVVIQQTKQKILLINSLMIIIYLKIYYLGTMNIKFFQVLHSMR